MRLINSFCISFSAIILTNITFSQTAITRYCNANQSIYDKAASDSTFSAQWDSIKTLQNNNLQDYLQHQASSRATLYIPVVYHILHQGGDENISNEQILSDLEQINDMFNKQNPSWTSVNSNFTPGDADIQFLLAQKKNDGTCFSGITRTYSSLTNHNGNSSGVANAVKTVHGDFPGNKYLNIFVCKDIGGAAGYTTQPWNTGMDNGIYILHEYVGTTGTSNFTTENATSAHEAGHWLNLDHTWGGSNNPNQASNCSSDDGIGDTPNTIGWISCNPSGSSCSSLDNVENIMEYSYCPNHMFTNGQVNVMRSAAVSFVGGRSNVTSSSNHSATGIFADVLCEADFSVDKKIVCENEVVQFYDNSYHNATSWSWSFPGGTPSSSTAQNPTVTFAGSGTYNVTLTATNASGSKSVTKQGVKVLSEWGYLFPYTEGFESPTAIPDKLNPEGGATNNWTISFAAYSGSKSAYVKNFSNGVGAVAELSSHTLNLSNQSSATMTFQYAYAKKTSTLGESTQLLISNDCGNTWVVIRGFGTTASATNSSFVPSGAGDWSYQSVNIPSGYLTRNFRFKFRIENNGGNNFYVDDINFSGVASINEIDDLSKINIFPNPANQEATINIQLKNDAVVAMDLIDVLGKQVTTILSERNLISGENHTYTLNRNNLKNGVYFVRLTVNGQTQLQRVVFN